MTFTHKKVLNIYIAYEIGLWPFTVDKDFVLGNSLVGAFGMSTNANLDKYKYCGYGIGFDARWSFSSSDGNRFGKNSIIFGSEMSSSVHADNKYRSNARVRHSYCRKRIFKRNFA